MKSITCSPLCCFGSAVVAAVCSAMVCTDVSAAVVPVTAVFEVSAGDAGPPQPERDRKTSRMNAAIIRFFIKILLRPILLRVFLAVFYYTLPDKNVNNK